MGTAHLAAELDKSEVFCGICAVGQVVCDAMRKQGMTEERAAEVWGCLPAAA